MFLCVFTLQGDVGSEDLLKYLLSEEQVDTVVHFAAQTHVDNSFGNSIQFTRDNVLATHVLLECCKCYGKIRRFVYVSTDEVYGETRKGMVDEDAVLAPTNPYAATKAAAEALVKCYYLSFQLPVIITRGNNVYGPRQFPEKLIPKMALRLRHKMKW